jgi:hypothetical protein
VHTLWWAGWLLTDSARVTNLSRFAPDIDARQLARTEQLYWQLVAARLDFHFHHQTCNDFFSDDAIGIGASHESLRRRVDFGKIAEQMRQVAEVYERLADRLLDTAAELV